MFYVKTRKKVLALNELQKSSSLNLSLYIQAYSKKHV